MHLPKSSQNCSFIPRLSATPVFATFANSPCISFGLSLHFQNFSLLTKKQERCDTRIHPLIIHLPIYIPLLSANQFILSLSTTLIVAFSANLSRVLVGLLSHYQVFFSENTKTFEIHPSYPSTISYFVYPSIIHHCTIHHICKLTADN